MAEIRNISQRLNRKVFCTQNDEPIVDLETLTKDKEFKMVTNQNLLLAYEYDVYPPQIVPPDQPNYRTIIVVNSDKYTKSKKLRYFELPEQVKGWRRVDTINHLFHISDKKHEGLILFSGGVYIGEMYYDKSKTYYYKVDIEKEEVEIQIWDDYLLDIKDSDAFSYSQGEAFNNFKNPVFKIGDYKIISSFIGENYIFYNDGIYSLNLRVKERTGEYSYSSDYYISFVKNYDSNTISVQAIYKYVRYLIYLGETDFITLKGQMDSLLSGGNYYFIDEPDLDIFSPIFSVERFDEISFGLYGFYYDDVVPLGFSHNHLLLKCGYRIGTIGGIPKENDDNLKVFNSSNRVADYNFYKYKNYLFSVCLERNFNTEDEYYYDEYYYDYYYNEEYQYDEEFFISFNIINNEKEQNTVHFLMKADYTCKDIYKIQPWCIFGDEYDGEFPSQYIVYYDDFGAGTITKNQTGFSYMDKYFDKWFFQKINQTKWILPDNEGGENFTDISDLLTFWGFNQNYIPTSFININAEDYQMYRIRRNFDLSLAGSWLEIKKLPFNEAKYYKIPLKKINNLEEIEKFIDTEEINKNENCPFISEQIRVSPPEECPVGGD